MAALLLACTTAPSGPSRYRLADEGSWRVGGGPVQEELESRYPELFEVVLDPSSTRDPNLRPLRADLERQPVSRANYDALNAAALGYFAFNERARPDGAPEHYLVDSFRATKLAAVPWGAYGRVDDGTLRDAILDFYQDVATGEKPGVAQTAGRLASVVASLERKESDPARLARIRRLSEELAAWVPGPE